MKTLIISDELNLFHWKLIKSIFLSLTLLPISHGLMIALHSLEDSSQIMLSFMMLSMLSSVFLLSFCFALHISVCKLNLVASPREHAVFAVYRYVPLVFLATMVSYVALNV